MDLDINDHGDAQDFNEINRIIEDLWTATYRSTDVDSYLPKLGCRQQPTDAQMSTETY